MEEIDYEKLFSDPEFLEELRTLGIGVTDDFDNYYPLDRIVFNTFNYVNFNDSFNTEESRETKLYQLLTNSKTYVAMSNFIYKYIQDKIDTLQITMSIDDCTIYTYKLPVQLLFKDYKTCQEVAGTVCNNIFKSLLTLPFNKECLSQVDSNNPEMIETIRKYFKSKHHTDEFKSTILGMIKKYKASTYKKILSILENAEERH